MTHIAAGYTGAGKAAFYAVVPHLNDRFRDGAREVVESGVRVMQSSEISFSVKLSSRIFFAGRPIFTVALYGKPQKIFESKPV